MKSKEWLEDAAGADLPDSDSIQTDATAPKYRYDDITVELIRMAANNEIDGRQSVNAKRRRIIELFGHGDGNFEPKFSMYMDKLVPDKFRKLNRFVDYDKKNVPADLIEVKAWHWYCRKELVGLAMDGNFSTDDCGPTIKDWTDLIQHMIDFCIHECTFEPSSESVKRWLDHLLSK